MIAHELGHALGLGHCYCSNTPSLMKDYINTSYMRPQTHDIEDGIKVLYPSPYALATQGFGEEEEK